MEEQTWHSRSLNMALIEDYLTHCSDHFTPGVFSPPHSPPDPLAADMVRDVLWVVSGVIELTSTRYHHRRLLARA